MTSDARASIVALARIPEASSPARSSRGGISAEQVQLPIKLYGHGFGVGLILFGVASIVRRVLVG
jgi:hypothetical protein